jgi:hypothetical protein
MVSGVEAVDRQGDSQTYGGFQTINVRRKDKRFANQDEGQIVS